MYKDVTLEVLTEENCSSVRAIDRSDIPEAWVDSVDTILDYTLYGIQHHCLGHTYGINWKDSCIGLILLGEGFLWETDPPELRAAPFYRLMGFVLDRQYRNRGIGGAVLEEVVAQIYDEFGVRPIALGVHRDNKAAARFYACHGFHRLNAMEGEDYYFLRNPASCGDF